MVVKNGVFRHLLGSISKLSTNDVDAAKGGWLGVQVAAEPEMSRRRVHAVPYAWRAMVAEAISCTGCVSLSALKADGDLNLGSGAIKAKTITSLEVKAGTVTALSFVGDGSKLTGVGAKAGKCPPGQFTTGIAGDGSLLCKSINAALPTGDLEKVSNGVLSNNATLSVPSNNTPKAIPDNNPIGLADELIVPDIGGSTTFSVSVHVTNSDISSLEVHLYDPNNAHYVLHSKSGSGKVLEATYPTQTKPVTGNLASYNGKNPKGKWRLLVTDIKFLNNKTDGSLVSWAVESSGLSNKVVVGKGVIHAKAGLQHQVGASQPTSCGSLTAGRAYLDPKKGAFFLCDGGDWRKVTLENLCGDGVTNSDETCDDGNTKDGDGCNSKCQKNVCGDAILHKGVEQCDDGNEKSGDGCSAKCALETSASCKELLAKGKTQSGNYTIDPDGKGPAKETSVYCDMKSDGGGWTRVGREPGRPGGAEVPSGPGSWRPGRPRGVLRGPRGV